MSKKYMHPSRKKILDVMYGNDSSETNVHGWKAENKKREVGEKWTDSNGVTWVQKQGFKIVESKYDDVRQYIQALSTCKNPKCETKKIDEKHKKMIRKTGYCINCLAEKEHEIRTSGLWNDYENWKMASNELDFLNDLVNKFEEAYKYTTQTTEIVTENGQIEKWEFGGDIEKVKADMLADIENAKNTIKMAEEIKETSWEKIKDIYARVFEN